jgi:hypothetical protein
VPGPQQSVGIARWKVGLLGVGAVIAVFLLATTFVIDRSVARGNLDTAESTARLLPGDPWLHLYLATVNEIAYGNGVGSTDSLDVVRERAESAAELYPSAAHHQRVADAAFAQGDFEAMERALERAIELEPSGPYSYLRLHGLAVYTDDKDLEMESTRGLCSLSDYWCNAAAQRSSSSESSEPSEPAED